MPRAVPIECRSGDIKNRFKAILAENWIRVFVHASVSIVEGYRASKGRWGIQISAAYYFVQPDNPGVCLEVSHLSLKVLRAYAVSGVADRVVHENQGPRLPATSSQAAHSAQHTPNGAPFT
jgi:hypothetical protein